MKFKIRLLQAMGVAAVIGSATSAVLSQSAGLGGDKIKFPADPGIMYVAVDRADNKQFREYYGNAAAINAARKGEPLPAGSVITGKLFSSKLDGQGNPEKGADGRFIKDNLIGYIVMEKQKDWGAAVPAELRNGEWEYQVFTAAGVVNDKANLKGCYECHRDKVGAAKDFVFTLDKLAGK